MNTARAISTLALAVLALAAPVNAASLEEAGRQILENAASQAGEARQAVATLRQDNAALSQELARLKSQLKNERAHLEGLKSRFAELGRQEEEAGSVLTDRTDEMDRLGAVLRLAARQTSELLGRAWPLEGLGQEAARLESLATQDSYPGLEELSLMSELLFAAIEAGGRVDRAPVKFIGPDGLEKTGQAVFAGWFTGYYQTGEEVGFLLRQGDGLAASQARPSWRQRRTIQAFFKRGEGALPLDLAQGQALAARPPGRTLSRWLADGGPLVWPILLVGLAALIISIERLFTLGRVRANSDELLGLVIATGVDKGWEAAEPLLARAKGYASAPVMLTALGEGTPQARENRVQEAMLGQMPRLERFLPTLSVLAAMAPLLGLLGTVTGMIATFQTITRFGSTEPGLMASGISQALITTQLGLAVALPIMLVHHFFERRVDAVLGDMEEKGFFLLGVKAEDDAA